MPLQQGQLGVLGGFFDVECGQDIGLARLDGGDAVDGGAAVDAHGVALDAAQVGQGGFWRQFAAGEFEALAHDAVQDQRDEAQAGVGLDALGPAVEHRGDLDLGLEHLEATLDVGQRLVAPHHLGRAQILDIGDQHQLAVHELRSRECGFIDRIGEQIGLQVHLDDARQAGVADFVEEAGLGAGIRELAPALDFAFVLGVELAGQLIGALLQGMDACKALLGLLGRSHGAVDHHQAMALPLRLFDDLLVGLGSTLAHGLEKIDKLTVASPRHRQDELQRPISSPMQLGQRLDVVKRK